MTMDNYSLEPLLCILRFLFLLWVLISPSQSFGNWMYLGVSSITAPKENSCSNFPGLVDKQKNLLCIQNPQALKSVSEGAKKAIYECQAQFRNERWNCTLSSNYSIFGHVLRKGTRETAFIYSILSAGVVHSVTQACTAGNLTACTCDVSVREGEHTVEGWKWGGCSDNVQYGIQFSRQFVDASETQRTEKSANIRNRMNLHNYEVGRQIVAELMKFKCRCHGVSGSCAVQTCWKSLSDFRTIGDTLKQKYESPIQIARRSLRKLKRAEKKKRRVPIANMELVYVHRSPNYCKANKKRGILGTKGRECNKTSSGSDSCDLLCCGRGYNTQVVRLIQRCECKFIWCCYVKCKTCETLLDKHTCK